MKHIFIGLLLLLLTACSSAKSFNCDIALYNEIDEYELTAKYKVYYEKSFVTKIEKEEIYESKNDKTLNYFEEYKLLEYKNLNDLYGSTEYSVETKKDKIIVKATLDMESIDIKRMVKNKYIDRNYVISNRLTTGGIKKIYESQGAICEEINQ